MDTVAEANVCETNQTMEDCVLIHNSKIIMGALLMVCRTLPDCLFFLLFSFQASSDNSSGTYTYTPKSENSTTDCKGLRIRRGQLTEIFDSQYVLLMKQTVIRMNSLISRTLRTIYNVSGVAYSNQVETRSQIDARSIQNRWTSPINYFINRESGFTANMIATSKKKKAFLVTQSHFLLILLVYIAIANWQNNTCLVFNELPVITSDH